MIKKILVDADACPVKEIIINVCKEKERPVFMYLDSSHIYEDDYSTVKIVEKGFDSVDYYILNEVTEDDLVVTQDYGLAALVLTKKAKAIHQNGFEFTNKNIDSFLQSRYIGQKTRKATNHIKGPKKRTAEDDQQFERLLRQILS